MCADRIDLFTPVGVGPYELPNRIVMSPMTRSRAGEGNVPTSLIAKHYRQRSTAGFIVTEAAQVSLQGVGYPFTPGIHNEEQAQGWSAVTGVWRADRVGLHISPGNPFNDMHDSDPEALFTCLVRAVDPLGLAYLHVSEINIPDPGSHKEANHLAGHNEVTAKLRGSYGGTYVTNGGYGLDSAQAVLGSGGADLVSFGRLFISNPDLPERLRRRAPLNALDPETLYGGGEKGYTDYPFLE